MKMDLWVSAANTRRRREGGWSRKPTRKNWQLARLLNRPPEKPWAHLRGYTSEAKALNSERTNAGKPPKMRRVLCLQGFGIAMRIQQASEDLLQLNQGTLYPALLRLEQRGWITSKWGVSENNRKAKYYSLSRAGRKQLEEEAESWGRMSAMINRVLRAS